MITYSKTLYQFKWKKNTQKTAVNDVKMNDFEKNYNMKWKVMVNTGGYSSKCSLGQVQAEKKNDLDEFLVLSERELARWQGEM